MSKCKVIVIFLLTAAILFSGSGLAAAALVGGQNPLNTDTDTRDGASGIIFLDLTSKILQDSSLTGWNIYAQSYYSNSPNTDNTDDSQVQLLIFRPVENNYLLIGQSTRETVSSWNTVIHFDLASSIPVLKNDIIGWYYPKITQDSTPNPPGGVIGFDFGGNSVSWYWDRANGSVPPVVGGTLAQSLFNEGGGRTYSINVEGTPVPVPAAAWLLGSGIVGLAVLKRRAKS